MGSSVDSEEVGLSTVLSEIQDPVLALDGQEIRTLNDAARDVFAVRESFDGEPVSALFSRDEELKTRYEDALEHYTDVGGVIDDGTRYFDSEHPTIGALQDSSEPLPDNDVGIFTDGDLRYYHLHASPVTAIDDVERLVIFRDVTRLKGRERDLTFLQQVLSRILRHNLRNRLSVTMGNVEVITDVADEPSSELAANALDACNSLLQSSEKARTIQSAIEADEQHEIPLQRALAPVVAEFEDQADISADVHDITVQANPELRSAIEEVVENSVDHTGHRPAVSIGAERDGPWAVLTISDDGSGIPDEEIAILEERGETDFAHGTGAGLWLMYTVVQESDGDLVFDTDGGTTVEMRLPLTE